MNDDKMTQGAPPAQAMPERPAWSFTSTKLGPEPVRVAFEAVTLDAGNFFKARPALLVSVNASWGLQFHMEFGEMSQVRARRWLSCQGAWMSYGPTPHLVEAAPVTRLERLVETAVILVKAGIDLADLGSIVFMDGTQEIALCRDGRA